jgi:stearoyl-CoA desaturase (delta-9 desaturase)
MSVLIAPEISQVVGSKVQKQTKVRNYEWGALTPFVVVHVLGIAGALFSHASWKVWTVCAVSYVVRMFGVTGGYHRYFAHRTYKTSRLMQFFLAFLAQTSSQKGALWWASHHRDHHKYSDGPKDIHSPKQDGFWYAHVGWIYNNTSHTDYDRIRDLSKYPELRFLNKYWALPPILLGVVTFLVWGWSGLWVGFMFSTVLLWHGTFFINSLMHLWGTRTYATTDTSRNNLVLALITLGEGWHNNHHYYMHCARQGFRWWQVDITYYVIKLMSYVGLVWDVREPPREVVYAQQ